MNTSLVVEVGKDSSGTGVAVLTRPNSVNFPLRQYSKYMRLPRSRRESTPKNYKLLGILACAATYASWSEAWIASFVHVPSLNIPRSKVSLQRRLRIRPTSLAISRRDLEALRGDGDEDPEEKAAAAAAADAARNMLERMWASSETPREGSPDKGEATLDTPHGDEGQMENIFPTSCERGALEAATACRKALLDGKRALIVDVEVRQLEDIHPEFDPNLLAYFVGDIAKSLATMIGQAKVMYRGDHLVEAANQALEESNREAMAREMDLRDDVKFCSYLSQVSPENERYLEQVSPFADKVAAQVDGDDRLVIMIAPRDTADMVVVRKVIKIAQGRPVLLVNPRMTYMPLELSDFETAYALKQFKVVPVKMDMRKMAKRSPIRITKSQRHQRHIECQAGQVVPKVMTYRIYPDPFKLYIDSEGNGFELVESYDRKPMTPTLCLRAQILIGQRQREVSMELMRKELKRREQELLQQSGDLDEEEETNDEIS